MVDTFDVFSPGGVTTDADGMETTGLTPEGSTIGLTGGGSVASRDQVTRTVFVGGVERPVVDGGLKIPISAPIPSRGWVYVCTAAGPGSDPQNVGRKWRVESVPSKTFATARRLDVVEVD